MISTLIGTRPFRTAYQLASNQGLYFKYPIYGHTSRLYFHCYGCHFEMKMFQSLPRRVRCLSTPGADSIRTVASQYELIKSLIIDDKIEQAHEIFKQRQQHREGSTIPNAEAPSALLYGWLDRIEQSSNDKDMYHATDRASEVIFQWMIESLSNPSWSSPTIKECNLVLSAWSKVAHIRGVPQRAKYLLEAMEQNMSDSLIIDSYNYVLHAWAYSREHLRGSMAQTQFEKILRYGDKETSDTIGSKSVLKPNGQSYRIMIHAWVYSGESKAAFRATGICMQLLRHFEASSGDPDLQVSLNDYYKIFNAWTLAGDKNAAEKTFHLWLMMERVLTKDISDIRADIPIYRCILKTFSQTKALPNLGGKLEKMMRKIWEQNVIPDSKCFSYAIKTYSNCAVHKDLEGDPRLLAMQAHELLQEMKRLIERREAIRISTENYNDVIRAFSAAKKNSTDVAVELLEEMERPISTIRPNAETYCLVIRIIANSSFRKRKVEECRKLIQRAIDEYKNGNTKAKPNTDLYNSAIRACLSSSSSSIEDREAKFRVALQIFTDEIRGNHLLPNSDTYMLMLEASKTLLEPGNVQDKALERIFKNCCSHALIDRFILRRFKAIASRELYNRLVVDNAKVDKDGTLYIPPSWTLKGSDKYFDEKKINITSINVNGSLFVRSEVKDKRMRNLRSRRNQKMLRGWVLEGDQPRTEL
jgi:hypothetical protein